MAGIMAALHNAVAVSFQEQNYLQSSQSLAHASMIKGS
jgi:hypothetical protein